VLVNRPARSEPVGGSSSPAWDRIRSCCRATRDGLTRRDPLAAAAEVPDADAGDGAGARAHAREVIEASSLTVWPLALTTTWSVSGCPSDDSGKVSSSP